MSQAIKWLLNLNFIPAGWLTVLAGFAALLTGVVCFTGAGAAVGIVCPDDPWLLITGGLAAIGLGRRK